jgi:hypothetical protein
LPAGLYRVIATCPYGICETRVSEFLVGTAPVDIALKVDLSPTRGNVARVGPSNHVRVKVLDAQARSVRSANILVRDPYADDERWYKTNGDGEVDVEPLGITVIAVLYNGTLTEETFSEAATDKLRTEGQKLVIHLK